MEDSKQVWWYTEASLRTRFLKTSVAGYGAKVWLNNSSSYAQILFELRAVNVCETFLENRMAAAHKVLLLC